MSGPMNHSPSQVIAQLLIDAGVASDPDANEAWPVFYEGRPDVPDDLIQVVDTQGITQGRVSPPGDTTERHGLQFLVRSADRHAGYVKAAQIVKLLDEEVQHDTVEVDGLQDGDEPSLYTVWCINRTGAPIKINLDGRRGSYSINTLGSIVMTLDGTLGTGS